jgi:hypothetical protein
MSDDSWDFTDSKERPTPLDRNGVPDVVAARDRVQMALVEFTRALRRAGVAVPANASVTAAKALVEIGFEHKDRVRSALKATLVSQQADIESFERLFETFWGRLTEGLRPAESAGEDRHEDVGGFAPLDADPNPEATAETPTDSGERPTATEMTNWRPATDPTGDEDESEEKGDPVRLARHSPTGRSEQLSVPAAALEQRDTLDRSLQRLGRALAAIEGRRWEPRGNARPDVRRALRRSFATGGTVLTIPRQERRSTVVRCTLLVDVSRSVLDTIDRSFLIRFLRAATAEWHGTRTFLFDTHTREISRELAAPSPEATTDALDRAEAEWGGGTRIASAIGTVRRAHPDAIDRRTTVFVISDGLETDAIDALEEEMSWLSRRARLVLWENPLASTLEYEPTARGMAVSLPYVDGLFAFRGPEDVEEIARQLEQQGTTAIGYAYDPRRQP